jgi:hypothetical protein
MGLLEAKGNKPKPIQHTTPHNSLTKKKRKKTDRGRKKKEKKKALLSRLAVGAVKVFGIKILPNGWRFLFQNP